MNLTHESRMCNSSPKHDIWVLKAHMMLTCHPNTGAATPHRSGDRSVGLNVKPLPAPGLLGSSTSCLIPLLHMNYIFAPLQGLWHFPSRSRVDHSSPQWHNLKLVFKGNCEALNRATVCSLRVGGCISQNLTVTNRWSSSAEPASSHLWNWVHQEGNSYQYLPFYTSQ